MSEWPFKITEYRPSVNGFLGRNRRSTLKKIVDTSGLYNWDQLCDWQHKYRQREIGIPGVKTGRGVLTSSVSIPDDCFDILERGAGNR